jgi:hypothetical protein
MRVLALSVAFGFCTIVGCLVKDVAAAGLMGYCYGPEGNVVLDAPNLSNADI